MEIPAQLKMTGENNDFYGNVKKLSKEERAWDSRRIEEREGLKVVRQWLQGDPHPGSG